MVERCPLKLAGESPGTTLLIPQEPGEVEVMAMVAGASTTKVLKVDERIPTRIEISPTGKRIHENEVGNFIVVVYDQDGEEMSAELSYRQLRGSSSVYIRDGSDPASEKASLMICGPGGSGKTYLIKSLYFALFGLPGYKKKRLLNRIRNINAGPEMPTKVTLDFQNSDRLYRIERSCADWQATLESLDTQEYLALGCCEVSTLIELFLGLEKSDYISLTLPSPDHINPSISLANGVNKAFLQRIFQADYLENIWREILHHSSCLKQISVEQYRFTVPEKGSAVFQDDYYPVTLEGSRSSSVICPQTLSAEARAITQISLHLGIIKALDQRSGSDPISCLFLDRFLQSLSQASLETLTAGLNKPELQGSRLIFTSSNT